MKTEHGKNKEEVEEKHEGKQNGKGGNQIQFHPADRSHSLGGMIAQQVVADCKIKANYNVRNTVTFGSLLLSAGSREGTVKHLGDTSAVIPYASGSLFNNTVWAVAGLNRENGGYGMNALDAYNKSYLRADVWGKHDVTGTKNGNATLTLDLNTRTFFRPSAYA